MTQFPKIDAAEPVSGPMSETPLTPESTPDASEPPEQYVVVARRYRPQTFDELIGQEHVAQALSNAISSNRVGHAYLFTGSRGVGKTSAARIFAKALNCEQGSSPVSCNQCDICQTIGSGEDVDVLEIDGASNRGIDEIRQLRQNVNVRPSRSRHKIYIIDEVHMLTREAFNALLKTLEEPPEHVKFIFCTTEATKIPITILSRCQRFDFAGIQTAAIRERLVQIVEAEGVEADSEALEVLARRASGSMRDSQSLLEQLLAFSPGRLTLDEVNGMLGTAGDERLTRMVGYLVARDAAAALADLDTAINEGVDVAQMIEQLFGYFRDCMAAVVDCPAESFLYVSPASQEAVIKAGKQLGLQTVLAVMQILDHTLSRLRVSTQARILAELALVRICHLEDLDNLSTLIAQVQSTVPPGGGPPALSVAASAAAPSKAVSPPAVAKKKADPPPTRDDVAPPSEESRSVVELTPENVAKLWSEAIERISGMAADHAKLYDRVILAGKDHLAISFKAGYAFQKSFCAQPEQVSRFQAALAEVTGQPVRVEFTLAEEASDATAAATPSASPATQHKRLMEVDEHPMVHRASELFGAQPMRVDDPTDREKES